MTYREMDKSDIVSVIPLYIEYYNNYEDGGWTEKTVYKRISQVFTREDSYCLISEENGSVTGFVMGYFEQYDDCFAYDLIEIVIASSFQNKGLGTEFMNELEKRVREKGAMLIQLQAVNDKAHEHFYEKLGYRDVSNFVLKTKMI